MDVDTQGVAFLTLGLWLMGLPQWAGIVAGVYGLTLLLVLLIFKWLR